MIHLIKTKDEVIVMDNVTSIYRNKDGNIAFHNLKGVPFIILQDDEARQVWEYLSGVCIFTTKDTAAIQAEIEAVTFNAGDVDYSGQPETAQVEPDGSLRF